MKTNGAWNRWTRVSLAALLLGVHVHGCAGTGPASGLPPLDQSKGEPLEELHLTNLAQGTWVRIILRGDSLVSGKFRGVSRMDPESYVRRVSEFRAARTDSIPLPAIGSPIQVLYRSKDRSAHLDGFGYRSLELRWSGSGSEELVPFDKLVAVTDSSGHVWTRDALDMEVIRGRMPCFTLIEVDTEGGRTQVPVDQVENVIFRTSSGKQVVGVLAIVAIAVIVVAVLARPQEPQCQGPGTTPTWFLRDPEVRAALVGNASLRHP